MCLQLRYYLSSLTPSFRTRLLRRGLVYELPPGLRKLLLPKLAFEATLKPTQSPEDEPVAAIETNLVRLCDLPMPPTPALAPTAAPTTLVQTALLSPLPATERIAEILSPES